MPLQQTSGNDTADAYGGGAAAVTNYIEDVFSTWLYTGNSSTQTITNGIDLAGKGGLVWTKARNTTTNPYYNHRLYDSARGINNSLISNSIAANDALSVFNSWNTNGFTLNGTNPSASNFSGEPYASWTFRKQPKFFDVVTYTGTGANTTIAHNLGSVPGCIIVKRTDTTADWQVYHQSLANTEYMVLNSTAAKATGATRWNSTTPTSSVFSVGTDVTVNESGGTYVAYLFAHNAGGFGLTGTDNVISCGSYVGNGSATGPVVTLGYEPQWVLIKNASATQNWYLLDNMRGMPVGSADANLIPNLSNAESNSTVLSPTATGFQLDTAGSPNQSGNTFIYIAIRRGPMKVPTDGTKVFAPLARTGTGSTYSVTSLSFPPDLIHSQSRDAYSANAFYDRLRGGSKILFPNATGAEGTDASISSFDQNGFSGSGVADYANNVGTPYVFHALQRAPGFFDEVCYTGTGSNTTQTHNLGVVPELIIVKGRSGATAWDSYSSALANTEYVVLNTTAAKATGATRWNSTTPTASVFSIGTSTTTNASAATYVAYLFATCSGVSKVGSYTGNGTTQTINCGFTGGARFVLIKRTDATGDWYTYDTARGMSTLTDPYLLLNSTAAETATLGSVTTVTTGFAVNAAILAAINTNAATYIFLAVA